MSGELATSPAIRGHRAIIVAALTATYMQAVTISLPNAALLHIEGSLSMADDEVGWIFTSYLTASVITMTMARWRVATAENPSISSRSPSSRSALCSPHMRPPRCNSSPPASSRAVQATPWLRCH